MSDSTQKVLSKVEWRIAAWAAIAFFALDLDRSNISQANTDNFLEDLGLSTNGTVFLSYSQSVIILILAQTTISVTQFPSSPSSSQNCPLSSLARKSDPIDGYPPR
jgi:hypothetical protein